MAFNPNEHLIDLKGKDYLQVMWRLVWFREEKPLWCIDTKAEQITENQAVFTAKIYDENGVLKASGYGSETPKDFRDYIEKAETKAIGRALAMLGYGTQFAPELDGGERIVDSPVGKAEIKEKVTIEDLNDIFKTAGNNKELILGMLSDYGFKSSADLLQNGTKDDVRTIKTAIELKIQGGKLPWEE